MQDNLVAYEVVHRILFSICESRFGLEENAARTAAQVERSEIFHCLNE